jgi:hypothetical protein
MHNHRGPGSAIYNLDSDAVAPGAAGRDTPRPIG